MPRTVCYTELDDEELIDLNKKVNTWLASTKGKIHVSEVTYHLNGEWNIWSCRIYYFENE